MAESGTTTHFAFEKPNFRGSFWHEKMWANFDHIDVLLYGLGVQGGVIVTNWANATAYAIGDRVVDIADASIWQAVVAHTSGASPQTMAQYRAANPTHWIVFGASWAARGAWAQNTFYVANDIVYDANEHVYAIAITAHTSTAVGTIRTDVANWVFIADVDPTLDAATASAAAAAASAAAAAATAASFAGILTTQGDLLYRDASGAVRLPASATSGYTLKSLGAGQNPAWGRPASTELITKSNFGLAAALTLPIDTYFGGDYLSYRLLIHHMRPTVDARLLMMTVSADGGATFLAGTNYAHASNYLDNAGMGNAFSRTAAQFILCDIIGSSGVGNGNDEGLSGYVDVYLPESVGFKVAFQWNFTWISAAGNMCFDRGNGAINAFGQVTDIRLAFNTGNIDNTGAYTLLGIK